MAEALFDLSEEYESMLQKGVGLSGEDSRFFMSGRIRDMKSQLPPGFAPQHILDFGCGIGGATGYLLETFPQAQVTGVDLSEKAIEYARGLYPSERAHFHHLSSLEQMKPCFDLCYVNGVFHHIPPELRPGAMELIRRTMLPGGNLALFENNPWNPGTRMVMSRIPFDRDAITLTPPEMKRMLAESGFRPVRPMRFLFYFPRPLAWFRPLEPWLARLPLGAQYYQLSTLAATPAAG